MTARPSGPSRPSSLSSSSSPPGAVETRLDELDGLDALDGWGRPGLEKNGRGWPANDGAAVGPIKAVKSIKSVKSVKPSSGLLAQAETRLNELDGLDVLDGWKWRGFGAAPVLGRSQNPSLARSVIGEALYVSGTTSASLNRPP